ncbi:MAG: tRNA (N6-isopentenyl adenosine(37)-C2)-methylthiotransferase MiaB [Oscillospiraceae bacterium]
MLNNNVQSCVNDKTARLAALLKEKYNRVPVCYVRTYGCQQNVSDSEKIKGMMAKSGYEIVDDPQNADLIIFNTCAVREHAEDRVFGNVGELKKLKENNKSLIIALGGCMVQQPHIASKLLSSYPYVDVIFNTNELQNLPSHIAERIEKSKSVPAIQCEDYTLCEEMPIKRDNGFRAHIPVMYGCDNFCSYCVVPIVRGRERSRDPQKIEAEFKKAIADGYKDIMLLGQNVNSYGKHLDDDINFAQLLRRLNDVEGDFTIRFMTSHPKDATRELFDTIAVCEKISRHIHLPVQSGSDRILREMNRNYTRAQYLELIGYAKNTIEDVSFSSDIIVGFPGETQSDYEDTVSLVEEVGFKSLFTFIYSKREGTAAAKMDDDTPHSIKAKRLNELIAKQEAISSSLECRLVGTQRRVLITRALSDGSFEGRLDDNSCVTVIGQCTENRFEKVLITQYKNKRLYGKAARNEQ